MERSHEQAQLQYSKFSYALEQLQRTLRPVLSAIDSLRSAGNEEDLDPMSRARMHISLAYAVNSLFCMYLRTQGIDPTTHPVAEEIVRVQDAFMRMRKVEAGESTEHKPKPNLDRRKHIINAKKSAARLAALVFPEEDDLLLALQGKEGKPENKREEHSTSHDVDKGLSEKKRSSIEQSERSTEEPNGAWEDVHKKNGVQIDSVEETEGYSDPQGKNENEIKNETQSRQTTPISEQGRKGKNKKEKQRSKKKRKKEKSEKDDGERRNTDNDKDIAKRKKRKSESNPSSSDKRKKKKKRTREIHGKSKQ